MTRRPFDMEELMTFVNTHDVDLKTLHSRFGLNAVAQASVAGYLHVGSDDLCSVTESGFRFLELDLHELPYEEAAIAATFNRRRDE